MDFSAKAIAASGEGKAIWMTPRQVAGKVAKILVACQKEGTLGGLGGELDGVVVTGNGRRFRRRPGGVPD